MTDDAQAADDYVVSRLGDGSVRLVVAESVTVMSAEDARALGRLLMGAGGSPAFAHDEPWLSDNLRHAGRR